MNPKYFLRKLFFVCILTGLSVPLFLSEARSEVDKVEALKIGETMPNATLKMFGKGDVEINNLRGKVKIVSIVPQLNTPTCDEQTHQFSEQNGGLD